MPREIRRQNPHPWVQLPCVGAKAVLRLPCDGAKALRQSAHLLSLRLKHLAAKADMLQCCPLKLPCASDKTSIPLYIWKCLPCIPCMACGTPTSTSSPSQAAVDTCLDHKHCGLVGRDGLGYDNKNKDCTYYLQHNETAMPVYMILYPYTPAHILKCGC